MLPIFFRISVFSASVSSSSAASSPEEEQLTPLVTDAPIVLIGKTENMVAVFAKSYAHKYLSSNNLRAQLSLRDHLFTSPLIPVRRINELIVLLLLMNVTGYRLKLQLLYIFLPKLLA